MSHHLPQLLSRAGLWVPAFALVLAAGALNAAPAPVTELQSHTRGPHLTDLAIPSVSRAVAGPLARGQRARPDGPPFEVARLDAPATTGYKMLGVTWRPGQHTQHPRVEVKVRTDKGWGRWRRLANDPDGPDPRQYAASTRAGTEPLWVGPSEGVKVRVLSSHHTAPAGLEANLIDPGAGPSMRLANTTIAPRPNIITRRQWGANPKYRDQCWKPIHGATERGVVIHHTAGTNSYTKAQSDDLVRGIYYYHTRVRGWCDIGYNFLVSKYGQVFEGRAGGFRYQVRGAHAGIFDVNKLMTGIALMGNFDKVRPTRALRTATVRLVAWRLESFYRHPFGTTRIDGVRYPRIAGHRDVKATACPGKYVYAWLPTLRQRVKERIGAWRSNIYRKWQRLGGEDGWVGRPYRGERYLHRGRSTAFTHATIYSSRAGTHEVHGPIRRAYARHGSTGGRLGYPRTDVFKTRAGERSNFQGGYITWNRSTRHTTIHYR
ncbi:MAG: N-acetylmuramoyl-L-alanine amidase [Marmoricola sp.]